MTGVLALLAVGVLMILGTPICLGLYERNVNEAHPIDAFGVAFLASLVLAAIATFLSWRAHEPELIELFASGLFMGLFGYALGRLIYRKANG